MNCTEVRWCGFWPSQHRFAVLGEFHRYPTEAGRPPMPRQVPYAIALALLLTASGCGTWRDDTTGATRQIVAEHLAIEYEKATPSATLYDLSGDENDVAEIEVLLEEAFGIAITNTEIQSITSGKHPAEIRILDLANLARSKRFP